MGQGLDGRKLRATYKEADQLEYQDSLGQLVLATAGTVPDGLLLFLPSYALMDKLYKRWQVRCVLNVLGCFLGACMCCVGLVALLRGGVMLFIESRLC